MNEKKSIYIAGKINGLDNYKEIFKKAEDKLIEEGYNVMNPAVLGEGFSYETYLPICLLMLQACDKVYMLANWKNSKGAKVELEFAVAQGKEIIYQDENIKSYDEWCRILQDERGMEIMVDIGREMLEEEGRINELLSKEEAEKYFMQCTLKGNFSSIQRTALNRIIK